MLGSMMTCSFIRFCVALNNAQQHLGETFLCRDQDMQDPIREIQYVFTHKAPKYRSLPMEHKCGLRWKNNMNETPVHLLYLSKLVCGVGGNKSAMTAKQ